MTALATACTAPTRLEAALQSRRANAGSDAGMTTIHRLDMGESKYQTLKSKLRI